MNYELAKELKDAGFPQKAEWHVDVNAWGGSWYYVQPQDSCPGITFLSPDDLIKVAQGEIQPELYKLPTLSELITACGEDMVKLEHLFKGDEDESSNWWMAESNTLGLSKGFQDIIFGKGSTPEEAVARLWLALNKSSEPLK